MYTVLAVPCSGVGHSRGPGAEEQPVCVHAACHAHKYFSWRSVPSDTEGPVLPVPHTQCLELLTPSIARCMIWPLLLPSQGVNVSLIGGSSVLEFISSSGNMDSEDQKVNVGGERACR